MDKETEKVELIQCAKCGLPFMANGVLLATELHKDCQPQTARFFLSGNDVIIEPIFYDT